MSRDSTKKVQWFITYPKFEVKEKKELLDSLPPLDYAFVVEETHEDGTPHYHASIKLKKGLTKQQMLKWMQGKYPDDYKRIDWKPTRALDKAETYLKKEDPSPLVLGSIERKKREEKMQCQIQKEFNEEMSKKHAMLDLEEYLAGLDVEGMKRHHQVQCNGLHMDMQEEWMKEGRKGERPTYSDAKNKYFLEHKVQV